MNILEQRYLQHKRANKAMLIAFIP